MRQLLIAGVFAVLAVPSASAQPKVFTGETSQVGSGPHASMIAAGIAVREAGLGDLQLQTGQTLTRSILNVASGKTDIASLPNAAHLLLARGRGPYQSLGVERGSEMAARVRALIGFSGGHFIPIIYDDMRVSGWEDFRGRRVFTGPPSGSAAINQIALIEAVTGLEAGVDYEDIRMDWGAALQGMLDRKFDVFMLPGLEPSALVQQIASSGDITILGIPAERRADPDFAAFIERTGTTAGRHGTTSYDRAVSYAHVEDGMIHTMTATFYLGVNIDMPEETAYAITKAILDNIDRIEAGAAFMPSLMLGRGVTGIAATPGLELHPGSARALADAGIALP